jgi:nucleotide-binding universal stress UspA family protein
MLRFSNILVHFDSRNDRHPGLDWAASIARESSARLKIVEKMPDFPWATRQFLPDYDELVKNILAGKLHRLDEVAEPLRSEGLQVVTQVLRGRTSISMIREVLQDQHDLVVKEAKSEHSRQVGFFGTTATRLLRKCPCPLLIVKPDGLWPCQRVAAAVSAVPEDELHRRLNSRVIQLAAQSAQPADVVAAWSVYGESVLKSHMRPEELQQLQDRTRSHAEQYVEGLLAQLQLGDCCTGHVLPGEPGEVICRFVHDNQVDLLVMGTVARSGIAGLLTGNTAEQILNRVECSVLAVKPDGFVSPVR